LVIPADAAEAKKLGAHYKNDVLGELGVKQDKTGVRFDLGEWSSAVASRKNDDGTISFITVDPGMVGDFEFVLGEKSLTIRDAQHEYVFAETPAPAPARAPAKK
jgi:hypothetical protein